MVALKKKLNISLYEDRCSLLSYHYVLMNILPRKYKILTFLDKQFCFYCQFLYIPFRHSQLNAC